VLRVLPILQANLGLLPAEIRQFFKCADKNKDGELSLKSLEGLAPILSERQVLLLEKQADHPEKAVEVHARDQPAEHAPAALDARSTAEQIEALAQTLFAMFDTDKSGTLATAEVEKGLSSMGFSAEEMTEMFNVADKNFDGQLSLKEFQEGVMPILSERLGTCLDGIHSCPFHFFLFLLLNLRCISVYFFFFPFSHTLFPCRRRCSRSSC
jgi:Ca2+-binding EF-hand superfamily protein